MLFGAVYLWGCATAASNAVAYLQKYQGKPFQDSRHPGVPQPIPGRVQCAAYDLGGEGIAYHGADAVNRGSGELNPANGTYLNEFRMNEGVDISYTIHRLTCPVQCWFRFPLV
jgi:hypothetical protein